MGTPRQSAWRSTLRAARVLALSLLGGGALAADCGSGSNPTGCPGDFVRSEVGLCSPACAVNPTTQPCPSGFTCDPSFGCGMPCAGRATCHPGEVCVVASGTCERACTATTCAAGTSCNRDTQRCESADAGTIDSGAVDSGAIDSGAIDSGAVDSGAIDSGTIDSGAIDAGRPIDVGAVVDAPVDVPVDRGVDAGADTGSVTTDVGRPPITSCSLGLASSETRMTLASGVGSAALFQLDLLGTRLAWWDGTSLKVINTDGTGAASQAITQVRDLALSATHAYVLQNTSSGTRIVRLLLSSLGASAEELVSSDAGIARIAVAARVVWIRTNGTRWTVASANGDGTAADVIGEIAPPALDSPRALAVHDGAVFVSFTTSLGATGCYRAVRLAIRAGATAEVIHPSGTGVCSSTTFDRFAFEGDHAFFHSSSPPRVIEWNPSTGSRDTGFGRGDGAWVGVTRDCLLFGNGDGLYGIPRDDSHTVLGPLPMSSGFGGRTVFDAAYAYSLVSSGSAYALVRYGL